MISRRGGTSLVPRRRRAAIGLLGGLIVLTSCGGDDEPHDYGPEQRAAFVDDCATGDVTAETCGCFYDRMAEEVPFERFVRLDEELRRRRADDDAMPADLAAMAAGCAARHQGAGDG